jgi:histidinol-phosphate aminotransferase
MKLSIDADVQEIPYYPKAMMYGLDEGWVRLSSNENPFPPSPRVFTAILDALLYMNRYPGGEAGLKAAVGEKYGVGPEEVILGDGSNELIELSLKTMKHGTKNKVIISEPSFAFYDIASKIYGFDVCKVGLVKMKVDLKVIQDHIDEKTRLIFLNNPNNPAGTIFEDEPFRLFLQALPPEILVVVDEAYGEFAASRKFPRSISYIHDYPVLVLRTFSKAYGLAGLRVGYGIGDAALLSFLERMRQPFSVNMIALEGAKAALADDGHLEKVLESNKRGKKFLYQALKALSLQVVPTEANFLLFRLGEQAQAASKRLFDEKILIRWMGAYGLPDYIRVTIGTMEENIRFVEALKRIL